MMIFPNGLRRISKSVQREAYGESASLFRSHQVPWFLRSRRKDRGPMLLQLHSALKVVIDSGARGNSLAGSSPDVPGDRNQYRVTTPKLPPPPPVCAHQRSRFGSSVSRVAMTILACPPSSTVTTSTA